MDKNQRNLSQEIICENQKNNFQKESLKKRNGSLTKQNVDDENVVKNDGGETSMKICFF